MMRKAIRGFVFLALLTTVAVTTVQAQNNPDRVTVINRKDGSTKTFAGTFQVSPDGYQVIGIDKKAFPAFAPDDVVKVSIGDLPGVERKTIEDANSKEAKGDRKGWEAARLLYEEELKKPNLGERSKRYLEFKRTLMMQRIVDDTDSDKGWEKDADACILAWIGFLAAEDTKTGWEQWPATRACTRLQIERGKYDDAARTWSRVSKNPLVPAESKLEAAIQEIDMQIRGKTAYSAAATTAAELIKTATGAKKDRLVIYEIAAKAGGDGKPGAAIEKIEAEMKKTKDPSVHATGYSMMGEMYLADKKPADAKYAFLWVATVLNQDKDEAFKAVARLIEIFKSQMDEDQTKKFEDKLKKMRSGF